MTISRHYRSRLLFAAALIVPVVLSSGCSARSGSFGSRFVKPGEPAFSYDLAATPRERDAIAVQGRKLKARQAEAFTGTSLGTTLESTDQLLAGALLRASIVPSAENHRLVGEAYRNAGITDHAHKHFQRALKVDPCNSLALEGVARLWRDWRVPTPALGYAHRAVFCAPLSASAHNTLGTVFAAIGSLEEATRSFEAALRLEPEAPFALNNLCYVALQGGALSAALDSCRRALALQPSMPAASTNLALAYALQGDLSRAEGQLLESSDRGMALYDVGILRMSLGRYAEAAEAFTRASAQSHAPPLALRRALQARARAAANQEERKDD